MVRVSLSGKHFLFPLLLIFIFYVLLQSLHFTHPLERVAKQLVGSLFSHEGTQNDNEQSFKFY